ncbi:MAG: DUF2357 domain-containing protein [bacterium]|nr:DUF2357 domain-containing protein [Mycoplasmatota bacterium]MDD6757569.1 DUF2357 domain-containing protein [bacterium]MDY2907609.1 DUF2357 domain-containing protein [Candidatus Faecimonas sp.]
MEKEEQEVYDESIKQDTFLENMNSILSVKTDYERREYDYEWIDIIDETLPYIDNILRNPKRFIVNEEEVVQVEKSKKVTVESIIHLTQHTNYIQKIEDNGDVKPSKILNINKEESLDTYENRFVYTLINNTRTFFEKRKKETGDFSYFKDKKELKFEANTIIDTEEVDVSLNISSRNEAKLEGKTTSSEESIADRLKRIKVQLDGFTMSELMQTLSKLHVPAVRSPIRKTNVILKNPNFQKAEALWNYIQAYEEKDRNENEHKDYYDEGKLKESYNQAFLSLYIANKMLNHETTPATEEKLLSQTMSRLIENILDSNYEITEQEIKDLFNKQLKLIKTANEEKKRKIKKILLDKLEEEKHNFIKQWAILEENDIC